MGEQSATVDAAAKRVSATRVVDAPASAIFDLLADPRQHSVIDGSGHVKEARLDAPERLSLGAKFSMQMRFGVPYRITNEVVDFEEGRRIGWRHIGGHVWRYELEPVDDGSRTEVTEIFDWGPAKAGVFYPYLGVVGTNRDSIDRTLERLAEHFAGDATATGGDEAPGA
jgi:uncharacterized protein YndB with AHSA1/START domain